jgi:hypothetical protein
VLDPESVAATGSAASPLITGLFVYAIATTAYILIGLRLGESSGGSRGSQGSRFNETARSNRTEFEFSNL